MATLQDHAGLDGARLELVRRVISDREPSGGVMRVVLDRAWDHPEYNALTVNVRQPGWMKPVCPGEHLRQAKVDGVSYLIVIGRRAVERGDVELVITLAHEIEHVRQETAVPGIRAVGDAVVLFVRETRELDGGRIHDRYELPLEYHAEAAASVYTAQLLGSDAVRLYYGGLTDSRRRLGSVRAADLTDAAEDLASFLHRNWATFEEWFAHVTLRPRLPSLTTIRAFRDRYLPRVSG